MSSTTGTPMPQYQCIKKVHALKIKHVDNNQIVPEDETFAPFNVSDEFIARNNPERGGYYVLYEDGYESFSPAEAFESGYTLINQV